jgi:4'-phosphopantetheinyl transferase
VTVWWLARGIDALPEGQGWLSPAEAARAAQMPYAKRRSEYLIARLAAKHAIARAVDRVPADPAELAAIEVRHRPSGAPVAAIRGMPAPVSMSLTDRADWAVCVVARDADVGLGCDLELVEPRTPAFVGDYLTASEQRAVAEAADPDLVANLLWSAKESALKVLQTGLRRDTRSVEVRCGEGDGGRWTPLEVRAAEGTVFPGWWRRFGPFLLTVTASAPHGPPQPWEDPSGLESAVPSHRWMDAPRPPQGPGADPGP